MPCIHINEWWVNWSIEKQNGEMNLGEYKLVLDIFDLLEY